MISGKFIKYIIFAIISSLINIGSYFIVYNYILESVLISNLVAYTLSVSLSFKFNQMYVYKSTSKKYGKMILLYLGSKVVSYGLDSLVLIGLNILLNKYVLFNKIISNASTCILNYFIGDKIFKSE